MAGEKKELKVHIPDEFKGSVYANNMVVSHTKEKFILDFMVIAPPEGTLTSRVIVSPGHVKRIFEARRSNIKKFEDKFGAIKLAKEPKWKTFGVTE